MLITFTGSNSFQLKAELRRLVGEFVAEQGDMALEKIDGEEAEYERITEAVQSLPFLSSKKLVVLDRPGTQKAFAENFDKFTESISDSTDVVIVEPKPDKRSSYYRLLQKKTELKVFNELSEHELPAWLIDRAKELGGRLNVGDANYLVQRMGTDQLLLGNELQKLIIYNPQVTRQTIHLLTEPAPQSTIFQLLDAAFAGDLKSTMRLYEEQRALKVEPVQIVALLGWQFHTLAIVKTAGERSSHTIAKEAGINPFVVQKSQNIARKLTLPELKRMIKDLHDLDIKMKTTSVDSDEALQHFLISISIH